VSKTEPPKPIPQGTGPTVDLLLRAVDEADLQRPVDEWLESRICNRDQISHVKTALRFAGLLKGDCLDPKLAPWRLHPESRSRGLLRGFRDGYTSAGCAPEISALVGHPDLPKGAISRCLERERPFRAMTAKGTRDNSLRFAAALHERIVAQLRAQKTASQAESPAESPSPERFDANQAPAPEATRTPDPSPTFSRGQAATTLRQPDPMRYRVARQEGDQWVYALVTFERQESLGDLLDDLPPEEHARWLDGLAAALLHDADRLRQEVARRRGGPDRLPSRS
jgi:hypothetical protein